MQRTAILLSLIAIILACATAPDPLAEGPTSPTSPVTQLKLEPPIARAYLPDVRNWRVVDRNHLVLWSTPKRPFLIRLQRPLGVSAMTSTTLGVRRTGAYLTKFDSLVIDDWRYTIDGIWEITREQVDVLAGRTPKPGAG